MELDNNGPTVLYTVVLQGKSFLDPRLLQHCHPGSFLFHYDGDGTLKLGQRQEIGLDRCPNVSTLLRLGKFPGPWMAYVYYAQMAFTRMALTQMAFDTNGIDTWHS